MYRRRCCEQCTHPTCRWLQVAEVHAAALEQDASVFDYDGVFDSMQEAKVAPVRMTWLPLRALTPGHDISLLHCRLVSFLTFERLTCAFFIRCRYVRHVHSAAASTSRGCWIRQRSASASRTLCMSGGELNGLRCTCNGCLKGFDAQRMAPKPAAPAPSGAS